MDYGHPLRFGAFITPVNEPADRPVRLAQLAEQVGLDLVTFQDHPYQPAFHDTWTLMSWVAAQTERIEIAPNVMNVPLRPPAVAARAAASLDRLSGGRVALGLGAGGFWQAIESMGGPNRSPGESVEALEEAIDVIRQLWDTSTRRGTTVAGEHYRVVGAKRGPRPAHPVPLWIGAYKPRMLRLVGRKADGWLPSLQYLGDPDLGRGNAIIDQAATRAGRDPREIRRMLNVRPDATLQALLPLALDHGISTFILASDDPEAIEAFAQDLAPALRSAVEDARRERGTRTEAGRPSRALALRRPGIDYDGVPERLAAKVVEPGDFRYADVRNSAMRGGEPGLVIEPADVADVQAALAYARRQDVALAIRSGGHGVGGRSTNDGGIVIDLRRLAAIDVLDEGRRLVRIEPGATWSQVADALAPRGWALTSGDYGGVGVGGLATGGGIGWLVREHGLTIDHLVAADVVLADGSLVRASATERPELFWGLRGAGGNLGIVTAFEFEAAEVGPVGYAQLVVDASEPEAVLERWAAAMREAPRDVSSEVVFSPPRRGQPPVAYVMAAVDSADEAVIEDRVAALARTGRVLARSVQVLPYRALVDAVPGSHVGHGEPIGRSGLAPTMTPALAAQLGELVRGGSAPWLQLRALGGAVADVPEDATAFAGRTAELQLNALGARREALDREWDALAPHLSGLYIAFDSDPRPERVADAFPPATLERLRRLKAEVDPDDVFRHNFGVARAAELAA